MPVTGLKKVGKIKTEVIGKIDINGHGGACAATIYLIQNQPCNVNNNVK